MPDESEASKIYWTRQEYERFFKLARSFGAPVKGDSLDVYKKCMAQMPEARRRHGYNPHLIARMNEAREGLAPEGPDRRHSAPERRPGPATITQFPKAPIDVLRALPAVEPEPAPAAPEPPAPQQPEPTPPPQAAQEATSSAPHPFLDAIAEHGASVITDILLRVLTNPEVTNALREVLAVSTMPDTQLEQQQSIVFRAPKEGSQWVPRIVVAGGHSHVDEELRNISVADIRRWRVDENLHRLTAMVKQADLTIIVTNRMPHKAEYAIKSASANFIRHAHSHGLRELVLTNCKRLREERERR